MKKPSFLTKSPSVVVNPTKLADLGTQHSTISIDTISVIPNPSPVSLKEITTSTSSVIIDFESEIARVKSTKSYDSITLKLIEFPENEVQYSKTKVPEKLAWYSIYDANSVNEVNNLAKITIQLLSSNIEKCTLNYEYQNYDLPFIYMSKFHHLEKPLYKHETCTETPESAEKLQIVSRLLLSECDQVVHAGYLSVYPPLIDSTEIDRWVKSNRPKSQFISLNKDTSGTFHILIYKKDDKEDSKWKKVLFIENCTGLKKLTFITQNAFQLNINEKVIIFVAPNPYEYQKWLRIISETSGLYFEQDSAGQSKVKESRTINLQETLEKSSLPKLVEYSKENEVTNQGVRKTIRYNLFDVYQNVIDHVDVFLLDRTQDFVTEDKENQRVLFDIQSIKIPVEDEERYTASFALFNVKTCEKLTEDFVYQFNEPQLTKEVRREVGILPYCEVIKNVGHGLTDVTCKNCVFNINYPTDDVFIIAHFYKSYTTTLNKLWNCYSQTGLNEDKKLSKTKKPCNEKVKKYPMLIGFSFKKLYTEKVDNSDDFSPLIKYDSKYTLQDVCSIILEIQSNKGCLCSFLDLDIQFKLSFEKEDYKGLVTTALEGIQPFRSDNNTIVREIENLSTVNHNFYGFPLPINVLFLEIVSVNMSNIKSSIKMKNFCINVEVCEKENSPLPVIFGRSSSTPGFVKSLSSDVIFHSSTPSFVEEFKILLPSSYVPDIHLLFTFQSVYHEEKTDNKKSTECDHPFGYAWIKLFSPQKIVVSGERCLPVFSALPNNYLSYNLEKLEKTKNDPDLKFIDSGGKPIFKFQLNAHTNYHSSNPHLLEIINLVIEKGITDVSVLEIIKMLKVLESLESYVIVIHLYAILHFLFFLMHEAALLQQNDKKNFDEVHKFCVRVILRICGLLHHKKRENCLKKYIQYHFDPTFQSKSVVVHHVIVKHLHTCFHHSTEPTLLNNLFACSWFFFDVLVKCFAVDAISKGRITGNRKNLLDTTTVNNLRELVALIAYMIKDRAFSDFTVAKNMTRHMGLFITRCFSILDRGLVMNLLDVILANVNGTESSTLTLRYELLVHVINHKNFIPLNLPLESPANKNSIYSLRELTEEYTLRHFPLHLVLAEVDSVLNVPNQYRALSLQILINMLKKHYFDDRYNTPDVSCRVHMLYLPFITMIIKRYEHLIASAKKLKPNTKSGLETSDNFKAPDKPKKEKKGMSQSNKNALRVVEDRASKSLSASEETPIFDILELRQIFLSFFQILKCVDMNVVFDYLKCFLSASFTPPVISSQTSTPSRKSSTGFIEKFMIVLSAVELPTYVTASQSSGSSQSISEYGKLTHQSETFINANRQDLETNLQNEVFMIILDIIDRIYFTFKNQIEYENGNNQFTREVFWPLNLVFQSHHCITKVANIHTRQKMPIYIITPASFKRRNDYCYHLCVELLRLLNLQSEWLQNEAKYIIYLMLRCDYCYNSTAYLRSYISIIKACYASLNECNTKAILLNLMKGLWDLVKQDDSLSCGEFAVEISDLARRVRNIIRLTLRFDELKNIPECLIDGHCSIANSFSEIPELTQLWMEEITDLHEKYENFSEAAMCQIHIASTISVTLKRKGLLSEGPTLFKFISPNIAQTTVAFKEEALSDDSGHTVEKFIFHLKKACELFYKGERYELILVLCKIIVPLLEKDNNYKELSDVHSQLARAYGAIIKSSDKRFLGTYYRVLFLGQGFKEDHGCEYIYKEPKLTTLPEIVERLRKIYLPGCTNLQIIQESGKVKWQNLDQNKDYIQINSVKPHNIDNKSSNAQFLSHHNIDSFILETPFCLSGKAHGSIGDQCKRITIFKTAKTFPCIKKRIPITKKEVSELTPIEVAIEEMTSQVMILKTLAEAAVPNKVQLELKLQGSVSVTVNAGPIAYANFFLKSDVRSNYPQKHVAKLISTFKEFLTICEKALNTFEETIVQAQIPIIQRLRNDYQILSKDILELIRMETKLSDQISDQILV